MDFAEWLEYELVIQEGGDRHDKMENIQREKSRPKKEYNKEKRAAKKTATVLHGVSHDTAPQFSPVATTQEALDKSKAYCPYCCNTMHYLNQCLNFRQLTKEQKTTWVKSNNCCWRCGRHHQAAQCRLKVLCQTCKGKHLEALHDVNLRAAKTGTAIEHVTGAELKSSTDVLYLDRRAGCNQVLLKVSKVLL